MIQGQPPNHVTPVFIVKIGYELITNVSIAILRIPTFASQYNRRFLLGLPLFLPSASFPSFTHLSYPIFPFSHSSFWVFRFYLYIYSFPFVLYILCRVYTYHIPLFIMLSYFWVLFLFPFLPTPDPSPHDNQAHLLIVMSGEGCAGIHHFILSSHSRLHLILHKSSQLFSHHL